MFLKFEKKETSRDEILDKIKSLILMHKKGLLGGDNMPEDSNPSLDLSSRENYHYFTLPMALNYQRNSYKLWEAAKLSYEDSHTADIFDPSKVVLMSEEELRTKLLRYKVALQPVKHVSVWKTISKTIFECMGGDIRNLFIENNYSVSKIKNYIQVENKKMFPYLSGNKICNYWLYVMGNYTDARLVDREYLNVAPDTHVIQASIRLGLVSDMTESNNQELQLAVARSWENILKGTSILPIDVHTPLWLWSRHGFPQIVEY